MAQTREGALKIAAGKAGVTIEQYQARLESGEKWCTNCRAWHDRSAFGRDASRWDGLVPSCRASKNNSARQNYTPTPREPVKGRLFVPARDGDVRQARRRVNYFVECGLLPRPDTLPCIDCGHVCGQGPRRRHEYDHFLGYAAEHHEHVQPVCSTCHHIREAKRLAG